MSLYPLAKATKHSFLLGLREEVHRHGVSGTRPVFVALATPTGGGCHDRTRGGCERTGVSLPVRRLGGCNGGALGFGGCSLPVGGGWRRFVALHGHEKGLPYLPTAVLFQHVGGFAGLRLKEKA